MIDQNEGWLSIISSDSEYSVILFEYTNSTPKIINPIVIIGDKTVGI